MTLSTLTRGPHHTGVWTWGRITMPVSDLIPRAHRLWTWTAHPADLAAFDVRLDVRGDDGTGTLTVDGAVHGVSGYVGAGNSATFATHDPGGEDDAEVAALGARLARRVSG